MLTLALRRITVVLLLGLLTGCNQGVSFSPDGKQLVVATGSNLLVMNVDGTGVSKIPGGDSADKPSWSPDGRYIVWCKNEYRLSGPQTADTWLLDRTTGKSWELARGIWGPYVWREDGRRIVGTRFHSGGTPRPAELVWLDAAERGETLAVTTPCETAFVVGWLPGTDDVIFLGGSQKGFDLYLIEAGECKRVTSTGDLLGAGITNGGKRLVWLRGRPPQIPTTTSLYTYDLPTRTVQSLSFPKHLPVTPPKRGFIPALAAAQFSPDGKRIVLLSYWIRPPVAGKRPRKEEVYETCSVMNQSGTDVCVLRDGRRTGKIEAGILFETAWSNDGTRVALQELRGKKQERVCIYDVRSGVERVIYQDPRG